MDRGYHQLEASFRIMDMKTYHELERESSDVLNRCILLGPDGVRDSDVHLLGDHFQDKLRPLERCREQLDEVVAQALQRDMLSGLW